MERSPRILVFADEPMFIVNMLSELEDRGFAVEPMKPVEGENWRRLHHIDAAVFDLHQPNGMSVQLVSKLRRSGIPVVVLGSIRPVNLAHITGAQACLCKPVDYDRLADVLYGLVNQPLAIAPPESTGALQLSDTPFTEKRQAAAH